MTGILYIVATPIGNLEDITLRALRILKEVNFIAAEDTRHSRILLNHYGLSTPLISYHAHNLTHRTPVLVERIQSGESGALISDAGMPGISDPGQELIQAALAAEIGVVPIPGASAGLTALVGSGLATDRFCFEGFLSTQTQERRRILSQLQTDPRTLVLYEAPHRLVRTLDDLLTVMGPDRRVTVARELTKLHEEFWRGSLQSALAHFQEHPPRGEVTLILAGCSATPPEVSPQEIQAELERRLQEGLSRSQASRQVAQQFGCDRRAVYQLALQLVDPPDLQ